MNLSSFGVPDLIPDLVYKCANDEVKDMMGARLRISLLIRSLDYGGAEKQITVLASGLARLGHTLSLLVFYPGGGLFDRVSPEVRVHCLQKRSRWHTVGFLRNLFSVLEEVKPDVLYSFLPAANILACLAKPRFPKLKIVWGIRASDVELAHYGRIMGFSYWLERRLSPFPKLTISNSRAGRNYAVSQGFPDTDRFIVIPNGIDTELFRPDVSLREKVRREWGILPNEMLLGIVGRLDPMKDHMTFLEAAAKVARQEEGVRFVSVGTGPENYAAQLRERVRQLGLGEKMIWAGPRDDLTAVFNAIDLLVSSSAFGEGFSNVLGEAMACGIPCIATDAGDAREILGDLGLVVPRRDPDVLATAVVSMLERIRVERAILGDQLRRRVTENYSVENLVRSTSAALEAIS